MSAETSDPNVLQHGTSRGGSLASSWKTFYTLLTCAPLFYALLGWSAARVCAESIRCENNRDQAATSPARRSALIST